MPARVFELIQGKAPPLTITQSESLAVALSMMTEHDYSQLPVVGADGKPIALLNVESIARAMRHFGAVLTSLRVFDAMDERFRTCDLEDELFDVLDALQQASAVLVLNPQRELTGILTSFDAMEFFRRRAQDIMLVQDIEETIKDYVLAFFRKADQSVDHVSLTGAIEAITPSVSRQLKGAFLEAVHDFMEARNIAREPKDDRVLSGILDERLRPREPVKPFERLSLNEYIELLLHQSRWAIYGPALGVEREALRRLLTSVRNTRNDLAHFRTDIADQQRDELLFCKDWLVRQEEAIKAAVAAPVARSIHATMTGVVVEPADAGPPRAAAGSAAEARAEDGAAIDEADDTPDASRYAALGSWLRESTRTDRVNLPFSRIEEILGAQLPASAKQYRAWWTNSERGHAHARQWLEAGWHVAEVSFREQWVTFVRDREREAEYRRFFGAVSEQLAAIGSFPAQRAPTGVSWHIVANAPDVGPRAGMFVVSFARGGRLRIELYLDTGEQRSTKAIFDALTRRKTELEASLGEPLSWERLDHRRASRIALYQAGSVLDADAALLGKAVSGMARFRQTLAPALALAIAETTTGSIGGPAGPPGTPLPELPQ